VDGWNRRPDNGRGFSFYKTALKPLIWGNDRERILALGRILSREGKSRSEKLHTKGKSIGQLLPWTKLLAGKKKRGSARKNDQKSDLAMDENAADRGVPKGFSRIHSKVKKRDHWEITIRIVASYLLYRGELSCSGRKDIRYESSIKEGKGETR